MKYRIILPILLACMLLSNNAFAFLPLGANNIIIQTNTFTSTKQGTYNKTLANNVVINSQGNRINFVNSTNNPIHVVNDPTRNQVNVTIADTTGASGVTSLNALNGALTIAGTSGNTTITTGGSTITVNTAWNTATLTQNEIFSSLTTFNNLKLGGQMDLNGNTLKSNGHVYTPPSNTGTICLTNQTGTCGISSVTLNGHTGNQFTITNVTDTNTAQIKNADGATIGLFGTRTNATQNTIKTLTKTGCITLTDNGTDILIGCTTGGVNSLNFTTSSDFDFNILPRNMSMINLVGTVFNFKLKPNIVLTNESAQTITKALTVNSLILGGSANIGSNTLINAGHASTLPSNTGTLLQQNSSGTYLTSIVHGATATSPITVNGSTNTISISCPTCETSASSGIPVVLANNVTSTSTTVFTHIWNIPLTANSGNAVEGELIASTNTAGGAVQVGANMSSIATGSGICDFNYASAATTLTTFAAALGTTSSDSAWTTILAGANQAYPIEFHCSVQTGSPAPTLQINFQAEVSSTVSIKAGSHYIKTP